ESASVPELAALYVGLGVDELSVAPARLDELRATVRALSAAEAATVSERALAAQSEESAFSLARELISGELGDQRGEVLGGRDGGAHGEDGAAEVDEHDGICARRRRAQRVENPSAVGAERAVDRAPHRYDPHVRTGDLADELREPMRNLRTVRDEHQIHVAVP